MRIVEFGINNSQVIIMLHGGGLSWWNYREEAEGLQDKYHVLLPILDGHADSDSDFVSIEINARELISYIDEKFKGSVLAICGLSLGAQILVEMLSQRSNICKYAIIESAVVIPRKHINKLIKSSVSLSYGLIKKKWFSKLQFASFNMKQSYYDEYYRDSCKITKENMIAFLTANSVYKIKESLRNAKATTTIVAGSKELKEVLDSAELLHETIDKSVLHIVKGYSHGELCLNHSDEYLLLLRKMIENK